MQVGLEAVEQRPARPCLGQQIVEVLRAEERRTVFRSSCSPREIRAIECPAARSSWIAA
jgi:hypothetical protein